MARTCAEEDVIDAGEVRMPAPKRRSPELSELNATRPWAAVHATGDLHVKKTRRRTGRSADGSNDADIHQLTVAQVAQICQVHARTVRNWVNTKKLKATRLDRLIRIDLKELKKFLRENSS